jgi:hypothetical protein
MADATIVDARRADSQVRAALLEIVREELRAAVREELRPQSTAHNDFTAMEPSVRLSAPALAERQRPPFLRIFTPLGTRASLLVTLPPSVASFVMLTKLAVDATTSTWSDRGWVNAVAPTSVLAVPYFAWRLYMTSRPGGGFCSVVSEATHDRRIPAKFARRLRVATAALAIALLFMVGFFGFLAYLVATKTNRLMAMLAWDPSASPRDAPDDEIHLTLAWIATLPILFSLTVLWMFQLVIVAVCVSVELHDVKELIVTSKGHREWQATVVPAATHLARTTLPALNRGWSNTLSVVAIFTFWEALVTVTSALDTGEVATSVIAAMTLSKPPPRPSPSALAL